MKHERIQLPCTAPDVNQTASPKPITTPASKHAGLIQDRGGEKEEEEEKERKGKERRRERRRRGTGEEQKKRKEGGGGGKKEEEEKEGKGKNQNNPQNRWANPGSNWRPSDLQSDALPTELLALKMTTTLVCAFLNAQCIGACQVPVAQQM